MRSLKVVAGRHHSLMRLAVWQVSSDFPSRLCLTELPQTFSWKCGDVSNDLQVNPAKIAQWPHYCFHSYRIAGLQFLSIAALASHKTLPFPQMIVVNGQIAKKQLAIIWFIGGVCASAAYFCSWILTHSPAQSSDSQTVIKFSDNCSRQIEYLWQMMV